MMLLRHLSFKTLLVASLFVVTLIPSLALVQTWWHLQQLAELVGQSQKQAEGLAELQRSYAEQSDLFERSTRQWNVLHEEAFSRTGVQAVLSLQQLAGRLQQLDETHLQQLGSHLAAWCGKSRGLLLGAAGQAEPWSRQYEELSRLGNELDAQVRRVSAVRRLQWDSSLRDKRQQADRVAILSLCLAVALGLLLAWLLVRPLQQLRDKIGRLALGQRGQQWSMSAPADILQLAAALRELDGRLAQLEQDKASFFRHVSHELKTPLAAIQEASSLLHDQIPGPLLPSQQEIIGITLSNTRLLRQRVDALLQHDAANWLGRPLMMEAHDVRDLVQHAAAAMQPLLQQKKLQLKLPGQAVVLVVDQEKFRTIIDNLLSNAIRFSPENGVISVEAGRSADHSWLVVADQGRGISEQERSLIFQPFYTGQAPAGESPGSGIGLTMVKTFAQLMGGDVESLPAEQGARLRVWWP
ncbi:MULTISPECIES: sensor histidine kinase KdpD [Aquitalea]|uniref:sensor histidine kinase n=1 Tax=Aquitalea TaxID=407217 RepID=UPI0013150C2E|nr:MULTISPECIES: HAMP domain-containing sensor histidine kinase [Aquitalea]